LLGLGVCAHADTIRIGGTGSGVGMLKLLGEHFVRLHPGHRVEVLPAIGSKAGIKAMRAGAIQIAISNSQASQEDQTAGVLCRLYGSSALAFISHLDAPGTDITRERLEQLLAGSQAQWSNGKPVRLVLRPLNDGDSSLLASLKTGMGAALHQAHARAGLTVALTDSDAVDYVEATSMALGTSSMAQVQSEQRRVKVLSLDGVMPSVDSVEAGRYPLVKQMLLCQRSDASEVTRSFVQFVLTHPEALALLRNNGHFVR
jgi:phosphate transport system substrate-binding protein